MMNTNRLKRIEMTMLWGALIIGKAGKRHCVPAPFLIIELFHSIF